MPWSSIFLRGMRSTLLVFGYSDYQTLNYWEHSPTWEDLFGDDFTDDLLDEDELDEAEADSDHSREQAQ